MVGVRAEIEASVLAPVIVLLVHARFLACTGLECVISDRIMKFRPGATLITLQCSNDGAINKNTSLGPHKISLLLSLAGIHIAAFGM